MGAEFALEADPGQLTASHPLYDTLDAATTAASAAALQRDGVPAVRILTRTAGGPWRAIVACTGAHTLHEQHGTGGAVLIARETTACRPNLTREGPVCAGCWGEIVASDRGGPYRCPVCRDVTHAGGHHLQHYVVRQL